MEKIILSVLICLTISGCKTLEIVNTPVPTELRINAQLMIPCENLPILKSTEISGLFEHNAKVAELYSVCSQRHNSLSEAVKGLTIK